MRDNNYLENRLFTLWEEHFDDIPRKNVVLIKFGKNSRRQLGSIRWANQRSGIKGLLKKHKGAYESADDKRISLITITGYYRLEEVPDFVVDATIAHELVHYVHGFHSPLQQMYKHPHRGGIIEKELTKRGLGHLPDDANDWHKRNWARLIFSHSLRKNIFF